MKPITLSDSAKFSSPFLQHVALNGVYTTLRTFYSMRENREMKGWGKRYCSQQEAVREGQGMVISAEKEESPDPGYPLCRHFRYGKKDFRPLNVVIFVMESWSAKYTGILGGERDALPFFSRLSKKGVLLGNFFANGQRSIEAISSIITSVPPCSGMVLSKSGTFAQMPVKFLPTLLREKSYKTFFIHGAKHGSMGLESLAEQTGIETCLSREDIAKEGGRDDGVWGIYDEDAFLYADRLFESQKGPFLAVIFSLSSHSPYRVPSEHFRFYQSDVPDADFLNVLRYSDYALSRYFEEASKRKYFDNTLFVIVGDHTEKAFGGNLHERYAVPCLLYSPSRLDPAVIAKVVTQVDLVPTILDVLRASDNYASFGQSAFSKGPGVGLLSSGDSDVFVKDGWMLASSANTVEESYNYLLASKKSVPSASEAKVAELKREKGHYLQLFHDLIMTNKFYKK